MPRRGRYREPSPEPASEPDSPNTTYDDYTPPPRPFGRNRAIAYSDEEDGGFQSRQINPSGPAVYACNQFTGPPPTPYYPSNSRAPCNTRNEYSGPSDNSKARRPKMTPPPPISGMRGPRNLSESNEDEEEEEAGNDYRGFDFDGMLLPRQYQPKQRGPDKNSIYEDDDNDDDNNEEEDDDSEDDNDQSFQSMPPRPVPVYNPNQYTNPPQQIRYNQYHPSAPVYIRTEYPGPSNRQAGRCNMGEQRRPLPRFSESRGPKYEVESVIEEHEYPRSRQKQPDRGYVGKYYNDDKHVNEDRYGCDEMTNILDQLTLTPRGRNLTLRKSNDDDDDDDDGPSSSRRRGPAKIVIIKDMHLHIHDNKIENFTWNKKEKGKGRH